MHKCLNYYVAMMTIMACGYEHQVAAGGPRGRLAQRLGRPVEGKDEMADLQALLEELKSGMASILERLAKLEEVEPEVKSADLKGLREDLAGLKGLAKDVAEVKGLDGKLAKLGEQISETERKINQVVVDAAAKGRKGKRDQKSLDALTQRMKNQEAIDVKSLDSDLKQQDIFNEETPRKGLGILAFVRQRPTAADAPRCSYLKNGTVRIKGEEVDDTTGASRIKRVGTVKTLEHEGLITQEDIDDAGALMLDDELTSATDAMVLRLRGLVVDDIETNLVDAQASDFDEDTDFPLLETKTAATWTADDILNLVNQVPEEYREGAIFVANSTMVPTLAGIQDDAGSNLFLQSLTAPIPRTLAGYEFIEEANVADGRLIFGNADYGYMVWERVKPELSNINRSGGDYEPYYRCRYAWSKRDTRAMAAMDVASGS